MITWKAGGSAELLRSPGVDETEIATWFDFMATNSSSSAQASSRLLPITDYLTGAVVEDWPSTHDALDFTVETDAMGMVLRKSGADPVSEVALDGSPYYDITPITAVWDFQRDGTWVIHGLAIEYTSSVDLDFYLVFGSRQELYPVWDPTVPSAYTTSSDADDITWVCFPISLPATDGGYDLSAHVHDEIILAEEASAKWPFGYDQAVDAGYPQSFPNVGQHPMWPTSKQDTVTLVLDFPAVTGRFEIKRVGLIMGSS